eukprot:gene37446-44920_t
MIPKSGRRASGRRADCQQFRTGPTMTDHDVRLSEEDSANGTALYESVKRMILSRIASGAWPPKHRIPSENELVAHLGVSRMTINRALRELAADGHLLR